MGAPRKTAEIRFWSFVNKTPNCWEWTGALSGGYGAFQLGRGSGEGVRRAHVYSYEMHYGDKGEAWVLHKCDNRKCVRPDHLFLGDNTANIRDMHAKGRSWQKLRAHCPNGHPYDGVNCYVTRDGKRTCKACRRERRLDAKQRRGYWL